MKAAPRVIPSLLLSGRGLVKTRRFADPIYLGDPRNVLRIFNDRECDEVVLLDIGAARSRRPPQLDLLREIVGEAFMPLAYGGGVCDLATARAVTKVGVEKVVINTVALRRPTLVTEVSDALGRSTVVVSIDAQRCPRGGYEVAVEGGRVGTGVDPVRWAADAAHAGAGEILLNSIDLDGTGLGYDLALIRAVRGAIDVPLIACGGARDLGDMLMGAAAGGADAVAAGRTFVLYGPHDAVLVSYPERAEIDAAWSRIAQ